MKIDEVRPSFTVYTIASDADRLGGVAESLGLAGYMVASFSELTAAFSEFYSNPPHFLLFDSRETKFNLKKAIGQVVSQLPESHIFLVTPAEDREKTAPLLELGVYDLILLPVASQTELVRALDRATERDYFMYMNERLMQEQAQVPSHDPVESAPLDRAATSEAKSDDFHLQYAQRIFDQGSFDDCVQVFLDSVSGLLGSEPVVFFKYVHSRRVLLAAQSANLKNVDLQGLGLNFNESTTGFRTVQLRDPMSIEAFVEMVHEVFKLDDFFAWPVEALGEIQGVVCFLFPPTASGFDGILREWLGLLEKALTLIESQKRLHVVTTKDLGTDLLNRQTFIGKISEEISRSRRTRLPISLVQIAVDQYGQLSSSYGQDEAQVVLKTAARILEKHSRVNDIIGRTGVDEFGLLLPHTGKQGAMIKAERLRRIFESADFGKVLAGFSNLTISLGVSEYPGLVRDAEELLQSADEALYQVRKAGNRTCIAKSPDGFEPDFSVEEKGS